MNKRLSEPFQTYWNGKAKRPEITKSSTTDKNHTDSQDEQWLELRQAIQHAAQQQWSLNK
ncbi:hypothetical protein [Halalkalibacter urbisdiaboli]|uniref:hypothetical protein n=1 Tax=Halalkalibacter urbisdiaboli TaxID=1960589 RepID=UPI000B44C355|nr:hypothetical protein [Halalkalibacter urbisdiaboli]